MLIQFVIWNSLPVAVRFLLFWDVKSHNSIGTESGDWMFEGQLLKTAT